MNAYCPDCETELDQSTGICPACRWDPLLSTAQPSIEPAESTMSLTERYRGTEYDMQAQYVTSGAATGGVSRGRAFVVVGLLAIAGLYAIVTGILGLS